MRGFRGLVLLEWKRHRFWSVGGGRNGMLTLVCIIGCLVLGELLVMFLTQNPHILFSALILLFMAASMGVPWVTSVSGLQQGGYKEWWLCMPYQRYMLVLAKFIANLGLAGRTFSMIGVSAVLAWFASGAGRHGEIWTLTPQLPLWLLSGTLVAVVSAPIVAALPCLALLFSHGIWKLGNVLFGLIIGLESGFFGGYVLGDEAFVTTSFLQRSALWLVAAGWPVAVGCLCLGVLGARRMATTKHEMGRGTTDLILSKDESGRHVTTVQRRPIQALLWLDMQRFNVFRGMAPTVWRSVASIIVIILVCVGFIIPYWNEATAVVPGIWVDISQMFMPMLLTQLIVSDMTKGHGIWWMSFPHSRAALLFTRGLGGLLMNWLYSTLGLLCIGIGAAVHFFTLGGNPHVAAVAWSYVWHVLLVCVLLNPIVVTFGFITSALQTGLRILLAVPIYFLGYCGVHFYVISFVFSKHVLAGPIPHFWLNLGLALCLGVPLGILCFIISTRTVHHFLTMRLFGKTT